MTGCREQYTIMRLDGKYYCHARYNPNTKEWLPLQNDVHKCDNKTGVWIVDWPEVGGGGSGGLTEDELFLKMHAWDQTNYIVAAGTKSGTNDDGLVDNHAYTVIEAVHDCCGTGINLFKVSILHTLLLCCVVLCVLLMLEITTVYLFSILNIPLDTRPL